VARINHPVSSKFIAFVLLLFFSSLTAHAQKKAVPSKTEGFLKGSTIPHTKVQKDIWQLHFEGKALKKFFVVATEGDGYIILFATVAMQNEYKPSPELTKKLLKTAWNTDRVKIGLNDEDAIIVRIDLSLRVTDKREFIECVDQVAAVTDQVFESIKPFLSSE
jgi:hypothetical protein